jgi:hypothetical protein
MENSAMTKQIKKFFVFVAFIGTVFGVLLSCRFYDDRIEIEKGGEWRYYSIDSGTILESLSRGNKDVFTLLAATPEVTPTSPIALVNLRQQDFILIAQALHEKSWGKSFGDLNLYNMSFDIDCSNIEQGSFYSATFKLFEVIQDQGEEKRIEHWITIIPSENLVYTTSVEYQPNVNFKEPIDLTHYQITAEEALQIADENGGYEKRQEVDNACSVSVNAPGPDRKGWQITYVKEPETINLLYKIAVDPQTGEYRVIYPSQ